MMISTEAEMLEQVKKQDQFIVFGKLSLIRILLRYLKKNDLLDKVAAVSVNGSQKRQEPILDCPVKSVKTLSDENKDRCVFIVESRQERWEKAHSAMEKHKFTNTVDVSYDLLAQIGAKEHIHLDFLCVGFGKCGTSSLHAALKKNKKVFLPKKKETLYLETKHFHLLKNRCLKKTTEVQ